MCASIKHMTTHTDLLGLSEIAELYGVHRNTANNWSRQRDFPLPIAQLKMGPVWSREEVVAWKRPDHLPRPGDSQYVDIHCAWCGRKTLAGIRPLDQPKLDTYTPRFLLDCACARQTLLKIYNNYEQTSIQTQQYRPQAAETTPKEDA